MKITWLGRSCFEIVTADGTVILCDPYHPATGYPAHPQSADIVTISHEHGDHNFTGWVQGSPEILRGEGNWQVKGVKLFGLASFHDDQGGVLRGANTVFMMEADGLRLCHLGDLGHEPGAELLAAIGQPDVLFIPVGGFYTIDGATAAKIAQSIGAKLTVAMHFKTVLADANIGTAEAFALAAAAELKGDCTMEFDEQYSGPGAVVLDFKR